MTEQITPPGRPECPLCVRRDCANCYRRDTVSRKWLALHFPDGRCRFCGAPASSVTEAPVRHTKRALYQEHTAEWNAPPVERLERDPAELETARALLAALEGPFLDAIGMSRRADNAGRYRDTDPDRAATDWNKGTQALLDLLAAVRAWKEADVTLGAVPCRRCPHPMHLHDIEGCTVTIPQTEDPDFGPTQTCPCCERGERRG